MSNKVCAYHATTPQGAMEIITSGVFKKGTHFAFDAYDALCYAGPIVFRVYFDLSYLGDSDEEEWTQFVIQEDVPIEKVCVTHHWAGKNK